MESLAVIKEDCEKIIDFIDEGLIEIEAICLIPTILENESVDSER